MRNHILHLAAFSGISSTTRIPQILFHNVNVDLRSIWMLT